jgi:SpoVK/Ycf46/Vps4 family AAA+-type ATPase
MKILLLVVLLLINCSNIKGVLNTEKYLINNLAFKYRENIPMTFEEINSYAALKNLEIQQKSFIQNLNIQKQNSMVNTMFLGGVLLDILRRTATHFLLPYLEKIKTKMEFKQKFNVEKTNVNFNNIVGYESVKKQLRPIIENLKNQKRFKKLKKTDGILFYGSPGCGKTYFVKALVNEIGIPIVSILIKDLIEKGGLITQKIDWLFEVLRDYTYKSGPVILFLDEIDFLMPNREDKDKIEQNFKLVLQSFLDQLDGDKELKGICIVACTNYKDNIDSALLRSGRIGTHIEIKKPDIEDILGLIKMEKKKENVFFTDEEIVKLANNFLGLSVTDVIKQFRIIMKNKKLS